MTMGAPNPISNPFAGMVSCPDKSVFMKALSASVVVAMRRAQQRGKMWCSPRVEWRATTEDVHKQLMAAIIRGGVHGGRPKALPCGLPMDEVELAMAQHVGALRDWLKARHHPVHAGTSGLRRGIQDLKAELERARKLRDREGVMAVLEKLALVQTEIGNYLRPEWHAEKSPTWKDAYKAHIQGLGAVRQQALGVLGQFSRSPNDKWTVYRKGKDPVKPRHTGYSVMALDTVVKNAVRARRQALTQNRETLPWQQCLPADLEPALAREALVQLAFHDRIPALVEQAWQAHLEAPALEDGGRPALTDFLAFPQSRYLSAVMARAAGAHQEAMELQVSRAVSVAARTWYNRRRDEPGLALAACLPEGIDDAYVREKALGHLRALPPQRVVAHFEPAPGKPQEKDIPLKPERPSRYRKPQGCRAVNVTRQEWVEPLPDGMIVGHRRRPNLSRPYLSREVEQASVNAMVVEVERDAGGDKPWQGRVPSRRGFTMFMPTDPGEDPYYGSLRSQGIYTNQPLDPAGAEPDPILWPMPEGHTQPR